MSGKAAALYGSTRSSDQFARAFLAFTGGQGRQWELTDKGRIGLLWTHFGQGQTLWRKRGLKTLTLCGQKDVDGAQFEKALYRLATAKAQS